MKECKLKEGVFVALPLPTLDWTVTKRCRVKGGEEPGLRRHALRQGGAGLALARRLVVVADERVEEEEERPVHLHLRRPLCVVVAFPPGRRRRRVPLLLRRACPAPGTLVCFPRFACSRPGRRRRRGVAAGGGGAASLQAGAAHHARREDEERRPRAPPAGEGGTRCEGEGTQRGGAAAVVVVASNGGGGGGKKSWWWRWAVGGAADRGGRPEERPVTKQGPRGEGGQHALWLWRPPTKKAHSPTPPCPLPARSKQQHKAAAQGGRGGGRVVGAPAHS